MSNKDLSTKHTGLLANRIPMEICWESGGYVHSYKGRSQMNVENINENSLPFKFAKMMEELEKEFIESASDTN